jgi:hypothetical protein
VTFPPEPTHQACEKWGLVVLFLYMSRKLKELLERVATWPDAAQEEAQASLEAIEQDLSEPYVLTDDDRDALECGADDVRRGRFASDAEVKDVFNRYRRP